MLTFLPSSPVSSSSNAVASTAGRPVSNAPMLSASSSNQSHFSFNRNGEAGRQSSSSYDFLPSVSFDDLHASIESASTDFKLTQFPSPTGDGSILDSKGKPAAKPDKTSSAHTAAGNTRGPMQSTTTTRTGRSGSIIGRPSTSSRQPSTSSIASTWSTSGDGLTAPAPVRSRRQSQYPPVSNAHVPAKPPRKSMGPGILIDSDTISSAQRRRPSLASERGGSDSTRTSIDGTDSSHPFNTSRAAKAKSVQPPPRAAQPGLSAFGVESNRLSLAARSPRLNTNNAKGSLNVSSSANKRASMMPGTGHSAHASGLGARTISPTDTRRMKRMSMMPPPPQPMGQITSMPPPPPPPVATESRSDSRSPLTMPRKPSLTPSSARTTPDHHRKSHNSGLSIGSTSSFTTARTSTGSTQPRIPAPPPSSRLPAPKNNNTPQNSSGQNDDDEDVPPVPAIPKVYESPKENAPAETYFMDKKRSALSSVETLSIHSNSTGSISLPAPPEPAKPRRRLSARKSTHIATSSKDEKQPSQSRKHLQPLTLPPLNLAPLSMPTAAKVAALQDNPARDIRSSPPVTRQVPKTPTTPMTASKSSFFQNRYDDTMELPPLRSSSTVHHSHRKNASPPDVSSSDSSSIIIQDPPSKSSISPFLSSSLPKSGFDFDGHKRSKAGGDYATVSGNLTEGRASKKSHVPKTIDTKHVPKSPGPAPTPDEPPTPSSMSSLRRKLSMSWKRSASKNHGDVNDGGDRSGKTTEAVPRLPMSATANLHNSKTRSPSTSTTAAGNEQRIRKSSAQSLTLLPLSKSESWGSRKDSADPNTMPVGRIKTSGTSKSLRPKSSSNTLRQTGAYSANELDKDDLAAESEMRKMGSRRKETEIAARTLDALKKRASPKERVGPQEAIRIAMLNIYERGEIIDYNDIYFCGTQSARKVVGDLQSDTPNFGYDDERGDYTIVPGDHLAYRYEIVDILGKGSFGQVLRCIDHKLGKLVAIKIIRNKKRFHQQALVEVNILQKLREWVSTFRN